MIVDDAGLVFFTEEDILAELYKNPNLDFSNFTMYGDNVTWAAHRKYEKAIAAHFEDSLGEFGVPFIRSRSMDNLSADQKHSCMQRNWHMPDEYKEMDIAKWVLDQCDNDEEMQRAGNELLMFYERNMEDLLRYLKYLVDLMRKNKIVWGVGRGSSVSSFVLYKIGVHRVNSMYYDLSIEEFLR